MSHTPMKIDHVLNDIVMLVLDGHDALSELGIDKNKIYVKIVGYDEYGMWIYHPSFKASTMKKDKSIQEKNVEASILIPWGFIASVVHFPGVEGFDFPDPFDTEIGFEINS